MIYIVLGGKKCICSTALLCLASHTSAPAASPNWGRDHHPLEVIHYGYVPLKTPLQKIQTIPLSCAKEICHDVHTPVRVKICPVHGVKSIILLFY